MPFTPMAELRPSPVHTLHRSRIDLAKQDAAFSPATVKDKVKHWQCDGAGIVTPPPQKPAEKTKTPTRTPAREPRPGRDHSPSPAANSAAYRAKPFDIVVDLKTGQHAIVKTRPESRPSSGQKPGSAKWDPERRAFVRKRATRTTEDEAIRSATSPKKRVISDGHWRKDKSAHSSPAQPDSPNFVSITEMKPKKLITQKSTPDFRPKGSASRHAQSAVWMTRKAAAERPTWNVMSTDTRPTTYFESRAPAISSPPRDADDSDSTMRNVRKDTKQKRQRTPLASPTSEVQFSLPSPGPDDSISRVGEPKTAPPKMSHAARVYNKLLKEPAATPAATPAPRQPVFKLQAAPAPATRGNVPEVYPNRINAWLGGQSDPFVEDVAPQKSRDRKASQEPESIRVRKRDSKKKDRKPLESSADNRQFSFEQGVEDVANSKSSPRDKENSRVHRESPGQNTAPRQPLGLGIEVVRDFPSTGRALSTIASEITQVTRKPVPTDSRRVSSNMKTSGNTTGLKRQLTKHEDLMSVLSMPREAPSMISGRSMRSRRTRMDDVTIDSTLDHLSNEELDYRKELETMIDKVIPALLSSVLSRDSSARGGAKPGSRQNVTQPIVNMGVALERLRTHHKRIPLGDVDALLTWAHNAARIYDDYLGSWRTGYAEVLRSVSSGSTQQKYADAQGNDVDVDFLLKRPLVRVKNLTKTFRAINHCRPSKGAEDMSERYHSLVIVARKRSSDEMARIEDEAAANIDPTRTRDLKSLAPISGVRIDPSRSVRARDYFEMTLKHTTGQQLDCAVELLIRDNDADPDKGGDLLICEVSDTGRWLLFPPVVQDLVSARRGKTELELVVMIRGVCSDGQDWSELLTLHSANDDAVDEWTLMFSDGPIPPSPTQTAFTLPVEPITPFGPPTADEHLVPAPLSPTPPSEKQSPKMNVTFRSRTPSPTEVEVPIGEKARKTSKRWSFNMGAAADLLQQATPAVLQKVSGTYQPRSSGMRKSSRSLPTSPSSNHGTTPALGDQYVYTDRAIAQESLRSRPTLKRSAAARRSSTHSRSSTNVTHSDVTASEIRQPAERRPAPQVQAHISAPTSPVVGSSLSEPNARAGHSVWLPSNDSRVGDSDSDDDSYVSDISEIKSAKRPSLSVRTASTPSKDLPNIPKLRQPKSPETPVQKARSAGLSDLSANSIDAPSSAPGKLQKVLAGVDRNEKTENPAKTKTSFSPANFLKQLRKASSPLKREYAPADRRTRDSDYSDDEDMSDSDSISLYSEEGAAKEVVEPKAPAPTLGPLFARATPPQSLLSISGPSLGPSNSASQGPYRSVPAQPTIQASKTVASIFSWSDRGIWDPLHPIEVSVFVTPGLIEAFSMSEASLVPSTSSPSTHGIMPLVALELTPLVPLRKGTALDISIRSPPTANSKIRSSSNVMFRSRSPEECEALYKLINQARINNPTYIALQNARPRVGTWSAQADRRNFSSGTSKSWFAGLGTATSRRTSTYRSNSVRKRQVSHAGSDSSVGSTFSALRRFSGSGALRSLSRGSMFFDNRTSSNTNSDGRSSGHATPVRPGTATGTNSSRAPSMYANGVGSNDDLGAAAATIGGAQIALGGVTELKIRLYRREDKSRWRDMGSSRLTVMLPDGPPGGPGAKKRILVRGATKGETLLDETLAEGAFERVARTGIAISVWRDHAGSTNMEGRAVDRGGVGAGKTEVFMVQMKTERDAAYTFSLLGKMRY